MNNIEIEKAIEDLKSYAQNSWGELNESFKLAISALEKQLNDGWILTKDRFPSKEERIKNDGRFIVANDNEVFQAFYNSYFKRFEPLVNIACMKDCNFNYRNIIDTKIIVWQELPEKYVELN